ncbi:hypothetical protein KUV47_18580 [Vannielia litorea]|uniref:hypothetical protein n=1 Tax=Vannielia litorea TaxID=1217970 RepID=UPI001C9873B1|nr:hypothetical protein [Vannielia litorea]MBY6155236.1 hypothetical protein [Vannielia litorea]
MADASYGWGLVSNPEDRDAFESAIRGLHGELANLGAHGVIDGSTRALYDRQVRAMAEELRRKATMGEITWRQAATEANTVRNTVMDSLRGRSTPLGRALAESLKSQGKTLNEMIARKTLQLFGPNANFNALSTAQQNQVYAAIVESAGKSNPAITARMRTVSRAGRGLLVLSLAVSVYVVATAEDKGEALVHEGAVTGAGIGGGIIGGAAAGLACGPGAPVCVAVGAFVGGALAAIGVDYFFF